ncbi:MAG: hypothetical protein HY825_12170 [Acidobacteria bacterium]|nr:hypothetical protein [Acidobacteriota bacterium]
MKPHEDRPVAAARSSATAPPSRSPPSPDSFTGTYLSPVLGVPAAKAN